MNEPLFSGFIEFEDKYDAEDAVKDLDDKRLCGERVKLEMSKVISCQRSKTTIIANELYSGMQRQIQGFPTNWSSPISKL